MDVRAVSLTDDALVLAVTGIVNAGNATDFFDSISQERQKAPNKSVTLDFGAVEYLTSAGLRALLRLHHSSSIRIINAQPSVMEILETTGFTKMMSVEQRLREVSIDGAKLVGRGANGEVYQLPDETVVKLFTPDTPLAVVRHERELAQQSLIQGIPTAIAYDIVTCGDRYGTVYEVVNSKPLSRFFSTQPDQFESYARKYVDLLRLIHATSAPASGFPRAKDIYHGYIVECSEWYTSEELATLGSLVDSIPDRDTLLHGDFHANNIMVMDGELLLIDMGDVSCGHPVFDFLATAATQANLVDLDPTYAETHTRMPVQTIKRLWSYLLAHYFDSASADEVARIDSQVRLFSKLKVAFAPVIARGIPRELIEASVEDARHNLIARADELIGTIDW